ncbi:fungal-specific transcription factor domain-domain-containing protein [Naematelia encephala]|uniref:Fungal-specific transcription factor domain-domain-containing protein n=1 Tax=Naematelia encephala TaxID=71784 RepID=A0A1Y2ALH5_9TREE|nr:fungal-specific transcription factor domain-domain-containing protein [Naematelia encephala]
MIRTNKTPQEHGNLPAGARLVRACTRCHERKIKCDADLPRCRCCIKGNINECDMKECVLWTYDHVSALEERLHWLEGLVGRAYEGAENLRDVQTGTSLAGKMVQGIPSEPFPEEVGLLGLRGSGSYMGSMTGITVGTLIASAVKLYQEDPLSVTIVEPPTPHRPTARAAYPPRSSMTRYVLAYIDQIHRWYPLLDLSRLADHLETIYEPLANPLPPDDNTRFRILMIAALMATPAADDPWTREEYFVSALAFLPSVAASTSLDSMRAILLLCVYGLRSWHQDDRYAVNVWQLIGHGVRLAMETGLSRNNWKWGFDEGEMEARRRVFWCLYAVERYVGTGTGRVLCVKNEDFDTKMPQIVDEVVPSRLCDFLHVVLPKIDLRPALHLFTQRRLLGDVMDCVYAIRTRERLTLTLEETSARVFRIQSTLVAWEREALTLATPDTIERDVLQLAFHQATLLVHRPSPAFPCPPPEVLNVCMGAARGTIRILGAAVERGSLDHIMAGWAGFNEVFSSGLTLMYCSWAGQGCSNAITLAPEHDTDLALSISILLHLTTTKHITERYLELYRKVVSAFSRMLGPASAMNADVAFQQHGGDAFDPFAIANDGVGIEGDLFEGLQLDEDAVEFIRKLMDGSADSVVDEFVLS